MIRKSIVGALTIFAAGCATGPLPQTSDEFVAGFKDIRGEGQYASMHQETVSVGLAEATRRLNKRLVPCLNGAEILQEGNRSIEQTRWNTNLRAVTATQARLTVQMQTPGVHSKFPEGGYYTAVIDLKAGGPRTTKVSYYYANTVEDDVYEPARAVLRGGKGSCKFW